MAWLTLNVFYKWLFDMIVPRKKMEPIYYPGSLHGHHPCMGPSLLTRSLLHQSRQGFALRGWCQSYFLSGLAPNKSKPFRLYCTGMATGMVFQDAWTLGE